MTDIEMRLSKLERQVRRWRAVTTVVALAGALALLIGAQRQPKAPAALTATGLTIVGPDGKPLATLGPDKDAGAGEGGGGARFAMHNAAGDPLIVARAQDDAAGLDVGLQDARGPGSATTVAWKKAAGGAVTVRAAKGDGEAWMVIDGDGDGGGLFVTVGEDGKPSWRSAAPKRKLVPFSPGN